MSTYIDTNVFLRFFDNLESAVVFMNSVKQANNKYFVPSLVINEIGWMLGRFYGLDKVGIVNHIERLINSEKFVIVYDYDIKKAVDQFKLVGVKLNDCYIWSYMKPGDQIVSYDHDFDKLPGIKRVEPKDLLEK